MSQTTAALQRKIQSAGDLQAVVRTMKALAASSIGQYEQSVRALGEYVRTVELGFSAWFHTRPPAPGRAEPAIPASGHMYGAVVFGSDQGLVGAFNEVIVDHAVAELAALPGSPRVWAVGERVHARLMDAGLSPEGLFPVPASIQEITPLVERIQSESEAHRDAHGYARFYVLHNRPKARELYRPFCQRLLPLEPRGRTGPARVAWPAPSRPQVVGAEAETLRALFREYHFISLFRACAESLASENASRLAAMERADKNIEELLRHLQHRAQAVRQGSIDEELFDVIAGFEAVARDAASEGFAPFPEHGRDAGSD